MIVWNFFKITLGYFSVSLFYVNFRSLWTVFPDIYFKEFQGLHMLVSNAVHLNFACMFYCLVINVHQCRLWISLSATLLYYHMLCFLSTTFFNFFRLASALSTKALELCLMLFCKIYKKSCWLLWGFGCILSELSQTATTKQRKTELQSLRWKSRSESKKS